MRLKTDHNVSLTIWLSLTFTMLTGVWKGSICCWYAALQTHHKMREGPDTSLPSSGEEEGQRRKGKEKKGGEEGGKEGGGEVQLTSQPPDCRHGEQW